MVKAALGEHDAWESLDQSILHEHILQIQEDDDQAMNQEEISQAMQFM